MANPLSIVPQVAIGTGVGAAVGVTVQPKLQDYLNGQWTKYQHKPPPVVTIANGVAAGEIDPDAAYTWAHAQGLDVAAFDALVASFHAGPGFAPALELRRRNLITAAELDTALLREHIPDEWRVPLADLVNVKLTPADVANAIQQSFIPDPGFIPPAAGGGPPFHITAETVDIQAVQEAAAAGIDRDRLNVLTQLSGNPPGPMELLQMWNRHIIDEESVDAGIREGRTKTKWIPALKELRHFILSPQEAANARLKGHATAEQSYAIGALHGADQQTMDLLFLDRGRPATPRQVRIGYARGAKVAGQATVDEAIAEAVRLSDIRPEYTEVENAASYSLPSPFIVGRLTTSGAFSEQDCHDIFVQEGWPEKYAALAAHYFAVTAKGAPTTEDPWVKRADTKLWTETQKAYIGGGIDQALATTALNLIGVTAAAQTQVFARWNMVKTIEAAPPPAPAP